MRRQTDHESHSWYTVVALSDLAVSGSESSEASLPGTDFPKPLQRNHKSLHPVTLIWTMNGSESQSPLYP